MEVYNALSAHLKNLHGERVYKISLDGGFTCPNRDGTKGYGGCIFCNERGSGEHSKTGDIKAQVESAIAVAKAKNKGNKFIAYFQNFSSTYAPIEDLKRKYLDALSFDEVVGLAIATRPDCITEEIASLIKMVAFHKTVWVELGLQTADERLGEFINRKYTNEDYKRAVAILHSANIPVVTHLIVGLNGENMQSIDKSIDLVNEVKTDGVKIHSLFILKETPLAKLYLDKKFTPISREFYIKAVANILTHISESVVVHRLTGDGEKSQILAPEWTKEKKINLNSIKKYMLENGLTQGCFYKGVNND